MGCLYDASCFSAPHRRRCDGCRSLIDHSQGESICWTPVRNGLTLCLQAHQVLDASRALVGASCERPLRCLDRCDRRAPLRSFRRMVLFWFNQCPTKSNVDCHFNQSVSKLGFSVMSPSACCSVGNRWVVWPRHPALSILRGEIAAKTSSTSP